MKITNNTVLITGGTSGIGKALAVRFLKHGNKVIILGRNIQKVQEVKKIFPHLHLLKYDITKKNDINKLFEENRELLQSVNVLVNNAGIRYRYDFFGPSENDTQCENELETNFSAHVKIIQRFIPILRNAINPVIINITSLLGIIPNKSTAIYCSSKAAFRSFTKSLRYNLDSTKIRVVEIIPPRIDTPLIKDIKESKMPLKKCVDEIISSLLKGKNEIRIGSTKKVIWFNSLFPGLISKIMSHK